MVKIIAELGQAHDGSIGYCHSFIDALKGSKIDAIKLQTHIADAESSKNEKFRVPFSYEDKNRFEYWKRMQFSYNQWKEIKQHCEQNNFEFISSPFSVAAFELLEKLNIQTYKIGSGCINNLLLIDLILGTNKKIIVSTGLANKNSIDQIIKRDNFQSKNAAFLHCVTAYPSKINELNLMQIKFLKDKYPNLTIGYSDHSGLDWPLVAAVTLGAEIIEFHVTFDKRSFGPDSKASLNIDDSIAVSATLKSLNKCIINPVNEEQKQNLKEVFGYTLAAKENLKKNDKLTLAMLETKKPTGMGICPSEYRLALGKTISKNISKGEFIKLSDLE